MSLQKSLLISLLLIAVGLSGRLLPHPWNMTPITAIALFSTAYLSLRYSFLVFAVTMVVADLFLGFYQWHIMVAVYASFALVGVIGLIVRKNKSAGRVLGCTLLSSVLFFMITNWAVWQFSGMYVHSFEGLMQAYILAIPFFKNSLAGDLLYSGVLFGLVEYTAVVLEKRKAIVYLS